MTDDIIKRKLEQIGIKYKITPRYFQIPREIKMNDSKAPKWFQEFEINIDKRFDRIEKDIVDIQGIKEDIHKMKNTPTMKKELNTKGD